MQSAVYDVVREDKLRVLSLRNVLPLLEAVVRVPG